MPATLRCRLCLAGDCAAANLCEVLHALCSHALCLLLLPLAPSPPCSAFLADYGAALMLVAFSGLSFAVHGLPGVPRRVNSPVTWDVKDSWTVARVSAGSGGSRQLAGWRRAGPALGAPAAHSI